MKKFARFMSAALAALMTISAFAACKGGEAPENPIPDQDKQEETEFVPKLDTQKEVTIDIASFFGNFEALDQVILDFNKFYPNVNIRYEQLNSFVSDFFLALYRKPDSDAYFALELTDIREPDYYARSYVVDGEFEDAYYYTTPDGCEYLIMLDSGHVSAECTGAYSYFSLTGAFLTKAETEAILDSLHLRFNP